MNSTLKYGLGTGFALGVLVFAGYSLEWYKVSFKFGWTILEICIITFGLYFGVREVRQIKYAGQIKYKYAVLEGLKILLLITLVHSLGIYMYFSSNHEKYVVYKAHTHESAITAMKKAGYEESELNRFTELVNTEFTPARLAKDNVIYDLLLGLIITLIIASILRMKDTLPFINQDSTK